jgi:hypothetical protein
LQVNTNGGQMAITIQDKKLELVKRVLELNNTAQVEALLNILKESASDFWENLSSHEKYEIETGREQLRIGESENWDSVYNRLK